MWCGRRQQHCHSTVRQEKKRRSAHSTDQAPDKTTIADLLDAARGTSAADVAAIANVPDIKTMNDTVRDQPFNRRGLQIGQLIIVNGRAAAVVLVARGTPLVQDVHVVFENSGSSEQLESPKAKAMSRIRSSSVSVHLSVWNSPVGSMSHDAVNTSPHTS